MTDRPAVLIMQRRLAPIAAFLEPAHIVYRFWEAPPLEAQNDILALIMLGEHPLDQHLVESLPNLKLIACFGAGYDGVDVEWCRARGLEVTHAPGVNADDVADHALALILPSLRGVIDGDRRIRADEWDEDTRVIMPSLKSRRLGIVGLGAIGEAVAHRAEAFRMAVQWWGPRDRPNARWPRAASLIDLARDSDVLVVACRADETNRGLISAEVIRALGPDGLLVNVARGQLVDEDAVIAALKSGELGQAALDVFIEEPTRAERWRDTPNILLTPHLGGATSESVQAMLGLLMQNLGAVLNGQPAVTPVSTR